MFFAIIICTYNNAGLLDKTLRSIAEQQVNESVKWTTLVVQNNCTDHTDDVVRAYMLGGEIPLLFTVKEDRQGLATARRRGVIESESEFIAFVDDDCVLAPDWIQMAAMFCKERSQLGALNGMVEPFWLQEPSDLALRCKAGYALINLGSKPILHPEGSAPKMVGAGLILRRQALLKCGWMDRMMLTGRMGKDLSAGEDTEMILRIRNVGYELWYDPSIRLQHLIPATRLGANYLCKLFRGFAQSDTALKALEERLVEATLWWRLSKLVYQFGYWIRRLVGYLLYDVVLGLRMTSFRRVQVSEGWGGVLGAWFFLWNGPRMLSGIVCSTQPKFSSSKGIL